MALSSPSAFPSNCDMAVLLDSSAEGESSTSDPPIRHSPWAWPSSTSWE